MLHVIDEMPHSLLVLMIVTFAVIVLCYAGLFIPKLSSKTKQRILAACLVAAVAFLYELLWLTALVRH